VVVVVVDIRTNPFKMTIESERIFPPFVASMTMCVIFPSLLLLSSFSSSSSSYYYYYYYYFYHHYRPGVKGRLMDLCHPTARKWNLAVTVAGGKLMEAIVVDNKNTGIECIRYLRQQRAVSSARSDNNSSSSGGGGGGGSSSVTLVDMTMECS